MKKRIFRSFLLRKNLALVWKRFNFSLSSFRWHGEPSRFVMLLKLYGLKSPSAYLVRLFKQSRVEVPILMTTPIQAQQGLLTDSPLLRAQAWSATPMFSRIESAALSNVGPCFPSFSFHYHKGPATVVARCIWWSTTSFLRGRDLRLRSNKLPWVEPVQGFGTTGSSTSR